MIALLVHGLGRTPCSLFGLASELRRDGHATQFFAYSPTFEPLPRILHRLTSRLQAFADRGEAVGLVGHSLGGLLLRSALVRVPELRVTHLVMMGTPNRPPRIAAFMWRWRLFRLVTRECGRFLASPDAILKLPTPAVPYTLIAGAAGPHALFHEPNDGIVTVNETRIADADEPRLVPGYHSFLMDHSATRRLVRTALKCSSGSSQGCS
jgi:pimeloyl-ACP methyl ester carboxylesterase